MQELNPLGLSKLNFVVSYNISVEPYYSFNKTTASSHRESIVGKLHSMAEIVQIITAILYNLSSSSRSPFRDWILGGVLDTYEENLQFLGHSFSFFHLMVQFK